MIRTNPLTRHSCLEMTPPSSGSIASLTVHLSVKTMIVGQDEEEVLLSILLQGVNSELESVKVSHLGS